MATPERMNPVDAWFLYAEDDVNHMHILSFIVLESRSLTREEYLLPFGLLGGYADLLGRTMKLPAAGREGVRVLRDLRVPMPDGVELLADLYTPAEAAPMPTVLVRTPYGRRGAYGLLYGLVYAQRGLQVLVQPASPTPWSVLKLCELIADVVPAGVVNVVTGPGGEIGKALATNPRIAKISFTGSTEIGKQIMQYAAESLIPSTTELGGKSPNIFFADVMDEDDAFLEKAVEGLVMFAFNKGEVCTCPSRALIHEGIYDAFMQRCLERIAAIVQGTPLDPCTQVGPQVSQAQRETIERYVQIGRDEGAEVLIGGVRPELGDELDGGSYYEPTVFKGENSMRVFQEEIFGPVLCVTTFRDEAEALEIANDTIYGLGAGVWTRDGSRAFRMGRAIKAGRVWTNCYHQYPAGAAFGGYKASGVGRENHRMMLDHYTQTKCLLVSYDPEPVGLF